jgi:membrane protease YdiL (CAAX protease family)
MLKMGESAKQQMGETTELLTQRQSLMRRILMFPLTRLLVVGIVLVLVTISVAVVADIAVLIIGQLHPVGLSVSSVSSLSNDVLEAMGQILLAYGLFAVAGIITAVLTGKVIERRSLAEVGLGRRGLLRNTLQGFGIGTGMLLLLLLMDKATVLLGLTPEAEDTLTYDYLNLVLQQVQPLGVFGYLALAFVITCFIAVSEEIVFRGLLFRILEEGLGSWLALGISALLFGMVHLGNFDDPTLLSVASQTAGGFSLAAAYMLTRKLWLPISIHWGWDFTAFAYSPEGLLTFGDASSDAVPALTNLIASIPDLVLTIVLLALVIRRGQIHTPRWMQRKRTHKKPYVDENAEARGTNEAVGGRLQRIIGVRDQSNI